MEQQKIFSRFGGLTLVVTPGFEGVGQRLKEKIESFGNPRNPTPTDLVVPEFGLRSNGEPVIRLGKDHIGDHDCVVLTSGPGTYEMQGRLFYLLGYLKGRRAGRIAVITSYLPLSRSDKDEGALELALAPHFIHLMKAAAYGHLDRIITFDLHCAQDTMAAGEMGLVTEVSIVRRVIKQALIEALELSGDKGVCAAFPDEGAQRQFERDLDAVCEKMDIRVERVYGTKRRQDDRDTSLLGLHGNTSAIKDSIVIIIDDEIATGSTNVNTAAVIKDRHHAKECWAVAVHGILPAGSEVKLSGGSLDRVFVADGIPLENRQHLCDFIKGGRLRAVSSLRDLADIIYYHHWGLNIRERRG